MSFEFLIAILAILSYSTIPTNLGYDSGGEVGSAWSLGTGGTL